ncbi:recombinase zinc beta ribbon domain-containing protein [Ketobacter sp.]
MALWQTNRPQYLLSGLTKCGVCGGGYSKINSTQYGCSSAKNKGDAVCSNRRTIKRETLENHVLDALQSRLMHEDLVSVFCVEYTKHLNHLHANANKQRTTLETQRANLMKERERLIQAIKEGIPASIVKDDLESVSERIERAEQALTNKPMPKPLLHPAMASRYHQAVKELQTTLNNEERRAEANEHLRRLIDKIVLTPNGEEKGLKIDLYGDLAGILNMSLEDKDMNLLERLSLNVSNDNQLTHGAEAHIDRIGSGGWI